MRAHSWLPSAPFPAILTAMTTRGKIDLALAGVLILGLLLFIIFPPKPEPSYNEIPLSEWIAVLETPGGIAQKEVAIRHIGTNAIPYLLGWIQYKPSKPSYLRYKLNQLSRGLVNRGLPEHDSARRAQDACRAFRFLGKDARGAIPELKRQAMGRKPANSEAMQALAYLGKDGLPPLMEALTNQEPHTRFCAIGAIQWLETNALSAVPALLVALKDSEPKMQIAASNALQKIDPEALKRATQK